MAWFNSKCKWIVQSVHNHVYDHFFLQIVNLAINSRATIVASYEVYKFYFWWRVCSVPSLRQSWITANSVNSQLRDIAPSRRYSSRLLPCKFGAFLILPTFSPAPSPLLLQVAELNAFPHIPAFFDLIRKIIWTHLLVLWYLQQSIHSRNGSLSSTAAFSRSSSSKVVHNSHTFDLDHYYSLQKPESPRKNAKCTEVWSSAKLVIRSSTILHHIYFSSEIKLEKLSFGKGTIKHHQLEQKYPHSLCTEIAAKQWETIKQGSTYLVIVYGYWQYFYADGLRLLATSSA